MSTARRLSLPRRVGQRQGARRDVLRPQRAGTIRVCDVHVGAAVAAAGGGVVLGPLLAALTVTVPDADATWRGTWWRGVWWRGALAGRPAGARRRIVVTLLAVIALGAVGAGRGFAPDLPVYCWLAASAVVLAVIDVDCHRLPNRVTFPLYVAGVIGFGLLALSYHDGGAFVRAILAAAVAFAIFFVLAFSGGVGFGDTKLAGALALYLGPFGWAAVLLAGLIGFGCGGLFAVALLIGRRAGWRSDFAFGPALLIGALVVVVAAHGLPGSGAGIAG